MKPSTLTTKSPKPFHSIGFSDFIDFQLVTEFQGIMQLVSGSELNRVQRAQLVDIARVCWHLLPNQTPEALQKLREFVITGDRQSLEALRDRLEKRQKPSGGGVAGVAIVAAVGLLLGSSVVRVQTEQPAVETAIATTQFITPADGRLTYGFGQRNSDNPILNGFHYGIDIANASGSPVYAAADGVVTFSGWDNQGLGNAIVIDHQNGYQTVYGHHQDGGLLVQVGDRINQGQIIGLMGSTGRSTGSHLHFEIIRNGYAVDPQEYVWRN